MDWKKLLKEERAAAIDEVWPSLRDSLIEGDDVEISYESGTTSAFDVALPGCLIRDATGGWTVRVTATRQGDVEGTRERLRRQPG